MMSVISLSSLVSMLARSRISSRSSAGRLCASSTTSTDCSLFSRRDRSSDSSSISIAAFDLVASLDSLNLAASISLNSSRDNVGLCRCTQCTRAGSFSTAARIIVVLPEPASPTMSVIPFLLPIPYSRLASASRCDSVKTRNRGLGVRSNGRSRSPKYCSYIASSADKRVDQHGQAAQHGARQPDAHDQLPPCVAGEVLVGLHERDHGQHG